MGQPSWIGQTLGGRYQILEVVGQGGMSSVFKAKDPNLQRIVAVKLIHPHLSTDPKFIVRFEEEARAVAQLRHPNIVQVYDFNHDQGVYYMVQEFVPGETLQARLRRLNSAGRRMSVEETIRYARDILNAMGYAHQRGMIHRDIKPANIMLDVQGQGILMDFGIVKILGGETHTATGAVVGTAMYMSPELIRGEPPDERSDIYSLGVTLFEMMSGHPPFEAESAMTLMMMHLNDPVPSLQTLRPEVPEDMVAAIQKSLAKDRTARFGSAAELSAALKRILDRLEGGLPYSATEIDESPLSPEPKPGAVVTGAAVVAAAAAATPAPLVETPVRPASSGSGAAASVASGAAPAVYPTGAGTQSESPAAGAAGTMAETPAAALAGTMAETPAGGAVVPPGSSPGGATAGAGAGGSPPTTPPGAGAGSESKRNPMLLYAILGVVGILILIIGGIWIGSNMNSNGGDGTAVSVLPGDATQTQENTPEPSATEEATATITPTPTETQPPTPTATLTALPLREPPPGQKFVRINGITVNASNQYEVAYETFEYTEAWGSEHVHFFFNTVPEEQAGMPGSGPWELYGGPRPFTVYTPAQRPANASAMCSLFAYPDHSIEPGSGTCYPLPDQVVLTALQDTVCRSNPVADAQVTADLPQWEMLLVKGRTTNSRWWNIQNPLDLNATCWASIDNTLVTGNLGSVPVADPTPEPGAAGAYTVQIAGISLDAQYNYVVEYETTGFTEAENSLHIHFFFDTVPLDQAGVPGDFANWIVYYGPRPFIEYNLADKPQAATQMCALVANPDHTVVQGTGNCFNLP